MPADSVLDHRLREVQGFVEQLLAVRRWYSITANSLDRQTANPQKRVPDVTTEQVGGINTSFEGTSIATEELHDRIVRLASRYQVHRHTSSCFKGRKGLCRMGFPRMGKPTLG
jgi:hypothetical protein